MQRYALLGIALGAWLGATSGGHAEPLIDYRRASADLVHHSNGLGHDGSGPGRNDLDHIWSAAGDWAVDYLQRHPNATAKSLEADSTRQKIGMSALPIDQSTWVFSFAEGEAGTIFMVSREGSRFRESWRIDRDRHNDKRFPALKAWSVAAAATSGGPYREDVGDITFGPLFGWPLRLPDDAGGHPRFAVDANYGELAGTTVASQFTVWRWDGKNAQPLYLKNYSRPIEGMANSVRGSNIHIEERTEYRTAFVTSPEIGRQMNTTIRLTPTGIEDLGAKPLVPEFVLVDEALWAALRNLPLDALLTPRGALELSGLLNKKLSGQKLEKYTPLGELMGSSVKRNKTGATVCWMSDGLENQVTFGLLRTAQGLRIDRVRASTNPDAGC